MCPLGNESLDEHAFDPTVMSLLVWQHNVLARLIVLWRAEVTVLRDAAPWDAPTE